MTRVQDALTHVQRLLLDTAPLIYLFERNPTYVAVIATIFGAIDDGFRRVSEIEVLLVDDMET